MKNTFIITAGGIGKRMNSSVPKQFLYLNGTPILMHTIRVFHTFDPSSQILVTLPQDWWSYWQDLCVKHGFNTPITLIEGGEERYDSIKNALQKAEGSIISVHDGVRPLVSHTTIQNTLEAAMSYGAAVPVLSMKESIRQGSIAKNGAVDRSQFFIVQTPQCFRKEVIESAYKLPFSHEITDDASLIEKSGTPIRLTRGNEENIKITTPNDILIAQALFTS